jgi:fluoroquinolone transport system permease protein
MRDYIAYRILLPLVGGTTSTLVGYPLIGLTTLPLTTLLAIAIVAGLSAPMLALVLASAAPNKVAGLAVVKVPNGVNLLPIAAFFLPVPLQYVARLVPTFWPMRALWSAAAGEPYLVHLAIGALAATLVVAFASRLFERLLLTRV